ncbi:hypothetical protein [Sphingobium yanoikuyae]|uniref:hypothetical protein n=1 Tax=Sphingobium yanoikuyae TaxID=13690 RepID=UPI0012FB9BFD|nr:hypothetical protein [Sphingobium yanoikuyae]
MDYETSDMSTRYTRVDGLFVGHHWDILLGLVLGAKFKKADARAVQLDRSLLAITPPYSIPSR